MYQGISASGHGVGTACADSDAAADSHHTTVVPSRGLSAAGRAALRRVAGSRRAMATQLRGLADTPPNVTVQVLPFNVGFHVGGHVGPFVILEFPGDPSTGDPIEPTTIDVESADLERLCLNCSDLAARRAPSPTRRCSHPPTGSGWGSAGSADGADAW
ncbi:Scr1 family TA system antitoxin-like transcriptional regulator [Nocardia huaxiensis]|uniref:Scr1 family TA system antitoxin-like transcriptional regulator n=1 Tax=Nocardia huaxiensis TaxID=2755382 RepID=UPI003B82F9E4